MKNTVVFLVVLMLTSCTGKENQYVQLADELERSLIDYILDPWYPRCLDTMYGGYIADFEFDWAVSESSQGKSLVNQTRHLWTTAFLYEHYFRGEHHPCEKHNMSKESDAELGSSSKGRSESGCHASDNFNTEQFLEYAAHGYDFIREHMWDQEFGGFYQSVHRDGSIDSSTLNSKTIYGQAFAVHGLAKYYAVTGEQAALDLAIEGFHWMDRHPHDKKYGGYFEILDRAGRPKILELDDETRNSPDQSGASPPQPDDQPQASLSYTLPDASSSGPSVFASPGKSHSTSHDRPLSGSPDLPRSTSGNPLTGLKEFNSSLHVMEALTELYHVWPDSLLRARLEEIYLLFRDTFIHPDGYLRLYFYPDWTLVSDEEMRRRGGGDAWHTQHITFGHDVETAFLLLEAAHALGITTDPQAAPDQPGAPDKKVPHNPAAETKNNPAPTKNNAAALPQGVHSGRDSTGEKGNPKASRLAKQLVDHALAYGWDNEKGGFYYIGYKQPDGSTTIYDNKKSFWVESEGLNALMLMHTRYPGDPNDYFGKFQRQWEYIDTWLIDKQHGGWYSYGLDNAPESKAGTKSNNWKTTYHDVRGMVRSIRMLREQGQYPEPF